MTAEPSRGELLTFLIADVRGYSAFTSAHGDEAAARLAGAFAEVAREVIEAHGGDLRELRGDEALGVFASAREALRAAVEMQATFADETARRPGLPLRVGIGLDAGEAIPVEQGYRSGALNLAARLCADAGPGEVLASQGVVHLARQMQGLRFEDAGSRELKGMGGPVPVVGVLADVPVTGAPVASPPDHPAPTPLPPALDTGFLLVGRDREARSARLAWRRARRGEGGLLLIVGEPGSGRTRLAAETAAAASLDGADVLAFAPDLPPWASPGGPATIDGALARAAGGPPLLVVADDLDRLDPGSVEQLAGAVSDLASGSVLLVATLPPPSAPTLRRLVDEPRAGVSVVRLGPLGADAVRAIAATYGLASGPDAPALPTDAILETSGGNAARIHRAIADWALRATADRLTEATARASSGWADQREREDRIARDLVGLQLARDRLPEPTSADRAAQPDEPSPFKGLAPFEAADAGWYFGRERLVAELLARVARSPLVGVVGPSGSGKSSLLRAGLLATLEAGLLPGSEAWPRVLLRPGADPLRALDRAVWAAAPADLRGVIGDAPRPLHALAEALPPGRRVVVVLDQAEEVFTLGAPAADQATFVDALLDAVADHPDRVAVVLGIRADLYGRFAAHPGLAARLGENHLLVGPMDRDGYRRAIERPATRAGLRIDPPLVDALLDQVEGEPGGLPLLSTALFELWGAREGRSIPLRALIGTGGVRGAVARLAERTYGSLPADQARVARALLLRLVAVTDDGTPVRRRVPLASLDADDPRVRGVLDALAAQRLVTMDDGAAELSHDALLAEWPRLRAWVAEDSEGRRLHERLMVGARDWESRGEDPAELWRGARLAGALEWAAGHADEPNDLERRFLAAGHAAERSELERQRRTNRRLRGFLAAAAAGLVLAVGTGILAASQWQAAEERRVEADQARAMSEEARVQSDTARTAAEQARAAADAARAESEAARDDAATERTVALGRQLVAQSLASRGELDRSLLLALEGLERAPSGEAWDNLVAALGQAPEVLSHRFPVDGAGALAASPDGSLVAVVGRTEEGDSFLRVHRVDDWSLVHGPIPASVNHSILNGYGPYGENLVFDPTGTRLAYATPEQDALAILDLTTGTSALVPGTEGALLDSVAWRASDGRLAWITRDDFEGHPVLRILEPDGTTLLSTPLTPSFEVAPENYPYPGFLSLDGRWVITSDGAHAQLFDADTGAALGELPEGETTVLGFAPDGGAVAMASSQGVVVRTLPDLAQVGVPIPIQPQPFWAEPDLDGQRLRAWVDGRSMLVHDLESGIQLSAGQATEGTIVKLARSDALRFVARQSTQDTVIEVVDPRRDSRLKVGDPVPLGPGDDEEREATISADGSAVAQWMWAYDSPVRSVLVGDVEAPGGLQEIRPDERSGIAEVGLTPDGRALLTLHDSGRLIRTERSDGSARILGTYAPPGDSTTGLLAGAGDQVILLGEQIRFLEPDGERVVPFPGLNGDILPDGSTLVASDCDAGLVRLIDLATAAVTAEIDVGGCPWDVDLSPDGKRILVSDTGSDRGLIQILSFPDGAPLGALEMQYGPSSPRFEDATGGATMIGLADGLTRWTVDPGTWRALACATTGRNLTGEEWTRALPDSPYHATCDAYPAAADEAGAQASPLPEPSTEPVTPSPSPSVAPESPAPVAGGLCPVNSAMCWQPPGRATVETLQTPVSVEFDGTWYVRGFDRLPDIQTFVRDPGMTVDLLPGVTEVLAADGTPVALEGSPDAFAAQLRARSDVTVSEPVATKLLGQPAVSVDVTSTTDAMVLDNPVYSWVVPQGQRVRFIVTTVDDRLFIVAVEAPEAEFSDFWEDAAGALVDSITLEPQ